MPDRNPYYQIPLTLSLKSMSLKVVQDLHCLFCGLPFIEVSDRIIAVSDGPVNTNLVDGQYGPQTIYCKRHTCKQRFRLEFA